MKMFLHSTRKRERGDEEGAKAKEDVSVLEVEVLEFLAKEEVQQQLCRVAARIRVHTMQELQLKCRFANLLKRKGAVLHTG